LTDNDEDDDGVPPSSSGSGRRAAAAAKNRRMRKASTTSSVFSDSGASATTTTPTKTPTIDRRRPTGRSRRESDVLRSDSAEELPHRKLFSDAVATPPLPILRLKIPRALLRPQAENAEAIAEAAESLYKKVIVRKEFRHHQRRQSASAANAAAAVFVQNRFAQKLRALNCKVDVQKFRFKVQ
jgi:hypothetical protein